MLNEEVVKFIKKLEPWRGQKIGVHIGTKTRRQPDDFESICNVCQSPVYHHEFCGAEMYVHIEGCAKIITEKLLNEEKNNSVRIATEFKKPNAT